MISETFCYLGNNSNPPDAMLRNGDAIEVNTYLKTVHGFSIPHIPRTLKYVMPNGSTLFTLPN